MGTDEYRRVFVKQLKYYMDLRGKNQMDLMNDLGLSSSTVSSWCTGAKMPRMGKIQMLADYFGINKSALIEEQENPNADFNTAAAIPPGFQPLPEMAIVPLIGDIACGTPITADENVKSYIGVPAAWHADFALECHGDSMAPKICDGDIVCIRKQPTVDPGQIAAVRIDEEATLKRFYRRGDVVQLIAENASYPPMVYTGEELDALHIEGLAVGFCRGLVEERS